MGNHRFRLTDMMPNAWFYKLRDMSSHTRRRTTRRIHNKSQPSTASTQAALKEPPIPCHRQNSFYNNIGSPMTLAQHISFGSPSRNTKAFDIHLPPNPPRKSPRRLSTHRKSVYKPSISTRTKVLVDQSRGSLPNASVWSDSDSRTDDEDALYYSISPCSDHLSSAADSLPSSDPFDEVGSWSSSCSPRFSSSTADIIIDLDQKPPPSAKKLLEKFDNRVSLPPILTKATSKYKPEPKKHDDLHQEIRKALHEHHRSLSIELLKHETENRRRRQRIRKEKATNNNKDTSLLVEKEPKRKSLVKKVRGRNSPRLVTVSIRKMNAIHGSKARRPRRRSISVVSSSRSSISESLAVIKCSYEPEKDFRDSMMEMIVEHHIQASKDLEELLACYLTLNSNEYHDLIVQAFEQVWCNMFSTPVCTAESLASDVNL